MKRITFVLALFSIVFLAGCGDKGADGAKSGDSAKHAFEPAALATPLPDGFKLPFVYHVRADRVSQLADGKQLRGIDVDVMDRSEAIASNAVAAMFAKAGFRASKAVDAKGGKRITYRHPDGRRVSVIMWSKTGRKTHAPGAKASAYFGWTLATPPAK